MSINYLPASILISLTDTLHSVARGLLLNILCSFPLVLGEKEGWSKFPILTSCPDPESQHHDILSLLFPGLCLHLLLLFFSMTDFSYEIHFPIIPKSWPDNVLHPSTCMMHELQYFQKQQVTLTAETFLSRNLSPGCLWNPTHASY